jgi:HSP20 family molecular chaperone IbpA
MAKHNSLSEKKEASAVDTVERTRSGKVFIPAVDIIENETELLLTADLPGVNEKSIEVTLENNILTLQGNVEENYYPGYNLLHQEYDIGDFQRSFTLSDSVDKDKIEAAYKDGVLQLRLPKAETVKPRKIGIKIG